MDHSELSNSRIAWVIPSVGPGGGGMRTILRHVEAAVREGCRCDVIVDDDRPLALSQARLADYYGLTSAGVLSEFSAQGTSYDLVVATANTTVSLARSISSRRSCYFVQDYEPWFYPMGDEYLAAERTYSLGLIPITIGRWLAYKLSQEYGLSPFHYDFCADLDIYHAAGPIQREHAACVLLQPDKPRRCQDMVMQTIGLLRAIDPALAIYTYGSAGEGVPDPRVTNLGLISPEGCADLYRRCSVGLCVSSSNPSRIPFEMMSCGLPVVDIYRENNLYDYCDEACVLADPSPDALATAILRISDDIGRIRDMGDAGRRFMEERPMACETRSFLDILERILSGDMAYQVEVPSKTIENHVVATSQASALFRDWQIKAKRDAKSLANPIIGPHIRVTIDGLLLPQGERVIVPVWSDPAQKDIVWYPATREDDGTWTFVIDLERHTDSLAQYSIHVYVVEEGGDKRFVSSFQRWLAPTEDSLPLMIEREGLDELGEEHAREHLLKAVLSFVAVPDGEDDDGDASIRMSERDVQPVASRHKGFLDRLRRL